VNKWRAWRRKNKVQYKCNDIENLQGLCITCNSKKGNRILFVAD
jgi:5-methylcytosine-specific restriction endonuclease McrA